MTRRNKTSDFHNGSRPFEDSVFADPLDTLGKARRRALVLAEAMSARGISSDADGSIFHAAQAKAIKARRAANCRFLTQHARELEFSVSDLERWAAVPARPVKPKAVRSYTVSLLTILLGAITLLLVLTWPLKIHPSIQRGKALVVLGLDTPRYIDVESEDALEIPEQTDL